MVHVTYRVLNPLLPLTLSPVINSCLGLYLFEGSVGPMVFLYVFFAAFTVLMYTLLLLSTVFVTEYKGGRPGAWVWGLGSVNVGVVPGPQAPRLWSDWCCYVCPPSGDGYLPTRQGLPTTGRKVCHSWGKGTETMGVSSWYGVFVNPI